MASKEYRSWYFGDRSFLFAAAISILWHLLWFISITIEVNQHAPKGGKRPEIVSLGAVLDDAIFKTLIESRTEFSKTYYRQPEEFAKETAVPQETSERYVAGDVVSMTANKAFVSSLKQRISGDKTVTEAAAVGIPVASLEDMFEISGDVTRDQLLTIPTQAPLEAQKDGLVKPEFQIFVDTSGKVSNVRVLKSSGDSEADHAWETSLYDWIFRPSTLRAGSGGVLTAKVVFNLSKENKSHV